MNLAPFLCLGGIEILNGNRALTYARTADPALSVALRRDPHPEPAGPLPENLACWCRGIEDPDREPLTPTYSRPDADPAPWWVPGRPESADFLGLDGDITLGTFASRAVTPRGQLGSTVGPLRLGSRILSVTARMLARTPAGMAYGERWLADALAVTCDECADEATVLPTCDGDPRTLRRVGLVDGPTFRPLPGPPACLLQEASFQLVAGLPWLYADPVAAVGEMGLELDRHCAFVTTEEWPGDTAVRVTLTSGADELDSVVVTATLLHAGISDCADATHLPEVIRYEVGPVPARHTLVIDAGSRRIRTTEDSTGHVVGGLDVVAFDGPLRWIEVGPCAAVCVCVDGAGRGGFNAQEDATVLVETVAREL